MTDKRVPTSSLVVGLIVTGVVLLQLVQRVMASGEQISFEVFIGTPGNILFTAYFCCLIFCAWLVRGHNNKSVLTIWALVSPLYFLIYFKGETWFLVENRNVYAFSWVATVGVIPLWLVFVSRKLLTIYLCTLMQKAGLFRVWASTVVENLGTTIFELRLRQFIKYWIAYEFIFAFYLVTYALLMGVEPSASIAAKMREYGHFLPFPYYPIGSDILTIWLMLIIAVYTYKDFKRPDNGDLKISTQKKAKLLAKFGKGNRKK